MHDGLESGRRKLEWARRHMPILEELSGEYRRRHPLEGLTIGLATHVEAKTGILVETLVKAGARVILAASDPMSTQDDVNAALSAQKHIISYAERGLSRDEYEAALLKVLDQAPDLIIDDAAELATRLHAKRPGLLRKVAGSAEQTTTGVYRLKAMEAKGALKIPAYAVNDTPMKRYFDNVHGTGESSLANIAIGTNLLLAGKNVVIVGYGYCGRGLAMKAKGWGAQVIVTEVDPRKALQAIMDGFHVMRLDSAARIGDFFITATGNINVISKRHMARMKDGAVLANAGHFDVEISLADLRETATSWNDVREGITEYILQRGKRLYLLAAGRLVNLTSPAAMGHPIEVMDQTFGVQLASAVHLYENRDKLEPRVYQVPDEVDMMVARIKLRTLNVEIDDLTVEQRRYLKTWVFD